MKNWGSGEWNPPDPQFFHNPLITGVRQAWRWDNFKKALDHGRAAIALLDRI
jgi:hypothetical protein